MKHQISTDARGWRRLRAMTTLVVGLLVAVPFSAGAAPSSEVTDVTLLFTNDLESAFDPIPAYWRDDVEHVGGVAQLATLVDRVRARKPLVFLFDAGDIFTGTLSKLTGGALPFELMITMGYDAMCIGNHEFEYGWEVLREAKQRAPFPVLAANIFYEGTDIPFTQPYAVLERDGFRIGVVGVIGLDAATALIPSHVRGLEFRDPVTTVRDAVARLRTDVDLVVVLAHQGRTAPMQTDAEAHPEVQRGIDADVALAGAVDGIDVLLCGHADAGTESPLVHPVTGTLIMQTYGHGTRLGLLDLVFDRATRTVVSHQGSLLMVDSDALPPHPVVASKLATYRARHGAVFETIGRTDRRIVRAYDRESDLGNLFADILKAHARTEIGIINAGALRGDLPTGAVRRVDLLDAFPFTDRVAVVEVTGARLHQLLEQSMSLERGMLQVSGLTLRYDLGRPIGERVLAVEVAGQPLEDDIDYRIATIEILAQGGDAFTALAGAKRIPTARPFFADVLEQYFDSHDPVTAPPRGRQVPAR